MDIEYAEPTELDLRLEKMALFMGCFQKVVKYQEEVWNSSNESYWEWTEGERWVDKNGKILNEQDCHGDSLLYHADWNWLHTVITKIRNDEGIESSYRELLLEMMLDNSITEVFNICSELIDKINNK